MPLVVADEQVGWLNRATLDALAPALAVGSTCELSSAPVAAGGTSVSAVRLAPLAPTEAARTAAVAALVADLVDDGFIPQRHVRHELQAVGPLADGSSCVGEQAAPLLRVERGAVVPFGVVRYGVHVNGWVRDPSQPYNPTPVAMWVATRAHSKATYPGLLDQMVAGGQPSGLSFEQNVRKECAEEASLPPEVLRELVPAGAVSYRYTARRGLSSATLMTYDLELPHGLLPLNADGEVESFTLMPLHEVLRSLRDELPLWRPNAALVAIDFLIRCGVVDRHSEPEYDAIVAGLRSTTRMGAAV
jgi:hypothetical protein